MTKNLTISEEIIILGDFQTPHLLNINEDISSKKRTALMILPRKDDEVILVNSNGFLLDSVFAGLTKKHIEHIAKNAPDDYKKNILNILKNAEMMEGVFEIAKSMDDDLGRGVMQNQDRVRNVIQYIKDNQPAFEF